MWEHPATVANVATLRRRGALVLEPAVGRLTGADSGRGRLPEPEELYAVADRVLRRGDAAPDLTARRVVVTAGGTREPIDPVRFIGNRSSGKQGYAFARAAAARGATVTLIAANVSLPDPAGVEVVTVETTEELRKATVTAAAGADAVVMAAAPCDFRPYEYATAKIKKNGDTGPALRLVATPDVAAEVGAGKPAGQVLVVFAAETASGAEAVENARGKRLRKHADLVVLNEVGPDESGRQRAFGTDTNAATVIGPDDSVTELGPRAKEDLADAVLDLIKPHLARMKQLKSDC
jgi:phosphopantothenoylcysteine decarboxylase / phosphopantothenate---cysteine ligase